jgi:hypothetical protein
MGRRTEGVECLQAALQLRLFPERFIVQVVVSSVPIHHEIVWREGQEESPINA